MEKPKLQTSFIVLCSIVVAVTMVYMFYGKTKVQRQTVSIQPAFKHNEADKTILFYNSDPNYLGSQMFERCDKRCLFVTKYNRLENYDVIFFLGPTLKSLAPHKRLGQVWIYYTHESPIYTSKIIDHPSWRRKFNWTMTYRRDSDFLYGYTSFDTTNNSKNQETLNIRFSDSNISWITKDNWNKKDRNIAWFVSNCKTQSQRERYVKKLTKFMNVDIMGACGNVKNICGPRGSNCVKVLREHYKFYLSFENSLCRDYFTEKIARSYLVNGDTIPIVRGPSYMYDIALPPGSFINTYNFPNIANFTKYIREIDRQGPSSYFQWRKYYNFLDVDDLPCTLCSRLYEKNWDKKYQRLYEDISLWIRGDGDYPMCNPPIDVM